MCASLSRKKDKKKKEKERKVQERQEAELLKEKEEKQQKRKEFIEKHKTHALILVIILVLSLWMIQKHQFNQQLFGPADKIKILEFSEFECPYCSRAATTMSAIKAKYKDIVDLQFKHFPLEFHKNAQKASEAAECARDQGKFWEMHDYLFAHQEELDVANLKKHATTLGLDTTSFASCLDSGQKASIVSKNLKEGKSRGISGTPGFFIEGHKVSGALPFSNFTDIIDKKMKEKGISLYPKGQVKIYEFSDFECPFCQRGYETMKKVKEKYGDKVSIEFKHFPLSFHENAQKAAEAAECARDQGKFWEMHDRLFENNKALLIENIKSYASDLELNIDRFNSCLDSGEKEALVNNDMSIGSIWGVSGTPAFFVNGEFVSGAQPLEEFSKIIDKALE